MQADNPTALAEHFMRRFTAVREAQGLSQQDVINRLPFFMHRSALAKLELGRRYIRLDEAVALAEALGVTIYAMLDDEPIEWGVTIS